MVIANLDNQVERVFGLSPQRKRAEQIDRTDDAQMPDASISPTGDAKESDEAMLSACPTQTNVKSLDDTGLPIWLL